MERTLGLLNAAVMRGLVVLFLFASLVAPGARGQIAAPLEEKSPEVDALIPWLLQADGKLREIAFSEVIRDATGKKIIAIDPKDATDQRVLKQIGTVLDEVVEKMNAPDSAIQSAARINEVSSAFEDMIRDLLEAAPGVSCDFPKTEEGRVQRSGYPDLRLVDDASGRVYYLDPKLFADNSRASSFRTFYYEPKERTNKVRDDAVHLILGFEHAPRKAGHWEFTRWDIVDLAHFKVRLKAEFQGNNRDMYRPEAIVGSSKRPGK
ncbi:MAG: hypothetical protein ABI946_10565 [Chthoniobacterales bacterium]